MSTAGPTSKEVVKIIRKGLSDAGISQRQAAEKTGISLATLNRRLTAQSPFFIYELEPLAEILGVTVSSLFQTAEAAG